MPRTDVGDVLRKVHRWLRPEGLLVNLQPYAQPIAIEALLGNERRFAGRAFEDPPKRQDMRSSLRTLADLTAEGLFSLRHEAKWQLQMHYSSAEDWREFIERPSNGGIEADDSLLGIAFERPDGWVVTTEQDLAMVYGPG